MKHIDPLTLTDEQLESCIEGSTRLDLLREILGEWGVTGLDYRVDCVEFAKHFQYALRHYPDPWDTDAQQINYDWGYRIATNINEETLIERVDR